MTYKHGTLENEILNAVWSIEENGKENINVHDIEHIVNKSENIRAYTTIKTVMDRLVEKKLLKREKINKKFCYKSLVTRQKMADEAIKKLLHQYFNNDVNLLMKTLEKQCLSAV